MYTPLARFRLTCDGVVSILDGYWGVVCDGGWDIAEAHVVCRQMGNAGAQQVMTGMSSDAFKSGSAIITWMNGIACYGTEDKLEVFVRFH